jgi:hypothetical protein
MERNGTALPVFLPCETGFIRGKKMRSPAFSLERHWQQSSITQVCRVGYRFFSIATPFGSICIELTFQFSEKNFAIGYFSWYAITRLLY